MGDLGRAFSLEVARSRSLINFRRPRRRFERAFSLELGRSGSILGPADAPELDFGRRNASIFEVCRRSRAFDANFVRTQQNIVKTDTRSTSELSRGKTTETKNRSDGAFDGAQCTIGAWTAHREGLGASPRRPGDAFGRLLAALGPPGASQDRPWGGIWTSQSRPERVRTRPRNSRGCPK